MDEFMPIYEYKVLPAPSKGRKGRGVKGGEARFAHALEFLMNENAAEGWDYQRSDMLPHEERQGIRSSQTTYRSVLVFRRAVMAEVTAEPLGHDTAIGDPFASGASAERATDRARTEELEGDTASASSDPFERLRQYESVYDEAHVPDDDHSPERSN